MNVICIDDNWIVDPALREIPKAPSVGEECVVVMSGVIYGKLFYGLSGYPPEKAYAANKFAPKSDIDETTFERNFKKELV